MRLQHFINEDKRTVVALIDQAENDVHKAVNKLFKDPKLAESFRFRGGESFLYGPYNGNFRGIARCHPDDTWDEDEGIKIATFRANRQYRRAFNREIINLMNVLTNLENGLQEMIDYTVFREDELEHDDDL